MKPRQLKLLFALVLLLGLRLPGAAQEYTLIQGDIPILLVSPHGGGEPLPEAPVREKSTSVDPHFTRSRDLVTSELTLQLYQDFPEGQRPSVLLCNIHRKYVDMNRPIDQACESEPAREAYRRFHAELTNELKRLQDEHGWVLLLDIHGQHSEDFDLVIGSRQGSTLSGRVQEALWGASGGIKALQRAGFTVSPEEPQEKIRLNGGNTVKHYAQPPEVEACQLEHGKALRFDHARNAQYTKLLAKLLRDVVERHRQ